MQTTIDVSHLTVRYGDRVAIRSLDLRVLAGEVVGVVGDNGAGKTSLLRTIAGLMREHAGTVAVEGHTRLRERRESVAFAPDSGPFYPVPARRIGAVLAETWPGFSADRFAALVKRLDVPENQPTSELSRGQMARLRLAITLSRPGRILVLDEPLAGIDPHSRDRIAQVLAEHLADTDQTALVSTHEVGYLEGVLERIVLLHRGDLAWDEAAEALRQRTGESIETWLRRERLA